MHRNVQIDFFRGLFLVIMTLDHLQYLPFKSLSRFTLDYTYQTFGFVATVEGFVFLSGLMVGMVYTPKLHSNQFTHLVYTRIWHIYKYHLAVFTLIACLFSIPLFSQSWPPMWDSIYPLITDPVLSLAQAAFLMYQPGLQDVLPMYMIFLGFTPWVLRKLESGNILPLIMLSLFLWALGQGRPQTYVATHLGLFWGWFELASWQLVFFSGLLLGYLHCKRPNFSIPLTPHYLITAIAILVGLMLYRHQYSWPFLNLPYDRLFMDKNLGIVRVINASALGYLLYALCQYQPTWFKGKFLSTLGQHSLLVFSYHVVLCYALTPLRPYIGDLHLITQVALLLLATTSLWIPIFIKSHWVGLTKFISRIPHTSYLLEKRPR